MSSWHSRATPVGLDVRSVCFSRARTFFCDRLDSWIDPSCVLKVICVLKMLKKILGHVSSLQCGR